MTTTTKIRKIRTRTKAPFAIVYVARDSGDVDLAGYAYTYTAALKRARRKGYRYVVAPVVDGFAVVEVEVVV